MHLAGETGGPLVALQGTAATAQDRSQVATLAAHGQEGTGAAVDVALVAEGERGDQAAQDAPAQHRRLEVVKRREAPKGVGLLARRWVSERRNAWAACVHRLAWEAERLAETLAGWHGVAFAILMLTRFVELILYHA